MFEEQNWICVYGGGIVCNWCMVNLAVHTMAVLCPLWFRCWCIVPHTYMYLMSICSQDIVINISYLSVSEWPYEFHLYYYYYYFVMGTRCETKLLKCAFNLTLFNTIFICKATKETWYILYYTGHSKCCTHTPLRQTDPNEKVEIEKERQKQNGRKNKKGKKSWTEYVAICK